MYREERAPCEIYLVAGAGPWHEPRPEVALSGRPDQARAGPAAAAADAAQRVRRRWRDRQSTDEEVTPVRRIWRGRAMT